MFAAGAVRSTQLAKQQRAAHVLRRWLSAFGKAQPIAMPALSPTMNSGKIAKWNVKEGDKLSSGLVVAEVETDKATVDFTFQDDDLYVAKLLVPSGAEDVKVGSPVFLVVEDPKDIAEVQKGNYSAASASVAPSAASAAPAAPSPSVSSAPSGSPADISHLGPDKIMPSARSLLASSHVGVSSLKGTGKGGRITKGDVLVALGKIPAAALALQPTPGPGSAAAAAASAPAPSSAPAKPTAAPASAGSLPERAGGSYKDSKPSTVRKVIASRLTESKATIPAQYASIDCRIDALLKLRGVLKEGGMNVSVNDLVIKAAAKALRAVPEANAQYDPKGDRVVANKSVDVSVAVATDGGLITPIVKDADALGVQGIADKVKDLAGRARANKLKPEEFQGGSFTISNLGMFGIDSFVAVINPPQACILAVGKGEKRVVYPANALESGDLSFLPGWVPGADAAPKPKAKEGEAGKDKAAGKAEAKAAAPAPPGEPQVATLMTVQLSSDSRVVEPAVAGQLLQTFRHYVENPSLLLG